MNQTYPMKLYQVTKMRKLPPNVLKQQWKSLLTNDKSKYVKINKIVYTHDDLGKYEVRALER